MVSEGTQDDLKKDLGSFIKSELQQSLKIILHEALQKEFREFLAQFPHAPHEGDERDSRTKSSKTSRPSAGTPVTKKTSLMKMSQSRFLAPTNVSRVSSLRDSKASPRPLRELTEEMPDRHTYVQLVSNGSDDEVAADKDPATSTPKPRKSLKNLPMNEITVGDVVNSSRFGLLSGVMVLLNAVVIGYDTNYRATNGNSEWGYSAMFETIFCIFFGTEISLRMYGLGKEFFFGEQKYWNLFDTLIVGCQLVEEFLHLVLAHNKTNFSTLRVLRILRIIRVVRVIRVLHLFEELRQIVGSMLSSFGVLMWSLLILFLMIYLFGVIFLQFILESGPTIESEALQYYFSSLPRTIFTLFESIVGGVNWDDVAQPLITDVSPMLAVFFTLYVASAMFAIMNMLTGVFVEKAMMCVREDKDYKLAYQIRNLFFEEDEDENEVDWECFNEKTKTKVMQEYLTELQISISETEGLFELLDVDNSGAVSANEIVDGCMRLRGPARALDLALLMREISQIRAELQKVFGVE